VIHSDVDYDTRVCYGVATLPINSSDFATSKEMWMFRPFNGALYSGGKILKKTLDGRPKSGDVLRCDFNGGSLAYYLNDVYLGTAFDSLIGPFYPAIQFYGSNRIVTLRNVTFKRSVSNGRLSHASLGTNFDDELMIASRTQPASKELKSVTFEPGIHLSVDRIGGLVCEMQINSFSTDSSNASQIGIVGKRSDGTVDTCLYNPCTGILTRNDIAIKTIKCSKENDVIRFEVAALSRSAYIFLNGVQVDACESFNKLDPTLCYRHCVILADPANKVRLLSCMMVQGYSPFSKSDGISIENRSTVVSRSNGNEYVLYDQGFTASAASWEFQLLEDCGNNDLVCFGLSDQTIISFPESGMEQCDSLWTYRCGNGSLYSRGIKSDKSVSPMNNGDVIRFTITTHETTQSVSLHINDNDYGICYSNIQLSKTLFPFVGFLGKGCSASLVGISSAVACRSVVQNFIKRKSGNASAINSSKSTDDVLSLLAAKKTGTTSVMSIPLLSTQPIKIVSVEPDRAALIVTVRWEENVDDVETTVYDVSLSPMYESELSVAVLVNRGSCTATLGEMKPSVPYSLTVVARNEFGLTGDPIYYEDPVIICNESEILSLWLAAFRLNELGATLNELGAYCTKDLADMDSDDINHLTALLKPIQKYRFERELANLKLCNYTPTLKSLVKAKYSQCPDVAMDKNCWKLLEDNRLQHMAAIFVESLGLYNLDDLKALSLCGDYLEEQLKSFGLKKLELKRLYKLIPSIDSFDVKVVKDFGTPPPDIDTAYVPALSEMSHIESKGGSSFPSLNSFDNVLVPERAVETLPTSGKGEVKENTSEIPEGNMLLYIKDIKGGLIEIKALPSDSVTLLKCRIARLHPSKKGPEAMTLLFGGQKMRDSESLESYNIQFGTT
jgi:hypothetical protein